MQDKTIERVIHRIRSRSELGIAKYGTTLTDNDLSLVEWLQHLQEELMDAINYAERTKQELEDTLNAKERKLLKTIALYFAEGGRDGDFYPEWVEDWNEEDLKRFELGFSISNGDDEIVPITALPISCTLSYLLSKLTNNWRTMHKLEEWQRKTHTPKLIEMWVFLLLHTDLIRGFPVGDRINI